MAKKKKITAGELLAELNASPEFVAREAAAEAERKKRVAEYRRAEVPVIEALREAGVAVQSVWDLVNTSASYATVIPVLLDHLQRDYPPPVREGIARALAVPEARSAWRILTRLYRQERDERVQDGLAVALAGAADDSVLNDIIELSRDRDRGPSRLLLLDALARSADPAAWDVLTELKDDPELKKEVAVILRRRQRRRRT